MELNHMSHPHPLVLSYETKVKRISFICQICGHDAFGLCYCCQDCSYALHKHCAEMAVEVRNHPLHLDHPLFLTQNYLQPFYRKRFSVDTAPRLTHSHGPDSECPHCLKSFGAGWFYHCKECFISFHTECVMLPEEIKFEFCDRDSSPVEMNFRYTHLSLGGNCLVCKEPVEGFHYLFSEEDDDYSLHPQCALLPKTVKHPRHFHDLTLHVPIEKDLQYDECYCDVCENDRDPNMWVYYCAEDEVAAHIYCGVVGLDETNQHAFKINTVYTNPSGDAKYFKRNDSYSGNDFSSDESEIKVESEKEKISRVGKEIDKIEISIHKHALVSYDVQWNCLFRCDVCQISIFGMTYICNDCELYMHKWCADTLESYANDDPYELPPSWIDYHRPRSHQKQALENPRTTSSSKTPSVSCQLCKAKKDSKSDSRGRYMRYEENPLYGLVPKYANHESHEHVLYPIWSSLTRRTRKEFKKTDRKLCKACLFPCEGMSLGCEECGFYLHLGCASYPPTGKVKTHMHTLRLNYSYKEDPRALEYFCDACEKPRNPNCWVYSCPDPKCYDLVAHLHCGVPKISLVSLVEAVPKDKDEEDVEDEEYEEDEYDYY